MWSDWFVAPAQHYLFTALTFVAVYASIVLLTRITGLRSFSKMSAPDFAMTVAVGSLFASSISAGSPPMPLAVFALACLFAGQWGLSVVRKSRPVARVLDNDPVLLMEFGKFLEGNMSRVNVTASDLYAKLREANVLEMSQVRAVVFETTGDISVLHAADSGQQLEDEILTGVER